MSLWGKHDAQSDVPKFVRNDKLPDFLKNYDSAGRQVVFIDTVEATLPENHTRGFKTPGWYSYYTIERPDGTLHYKSELLVAFNAESTPVAAGDGTYPRYTGGPSVNDDAIAADASTTPITISVQPSNASSTIAVGGILTVTETGLSVSSATYSNGIATFTGVSGTNITGNGTGAQFTVVTSGGNYAVTVTSGGLGYAAGDKIKVLGTSLGVNGLTPANDLIITVASIATHQILTITKTGTSTGSSTHTVGGTNLSGFGSGATFNVTASSGSYNVTIASAGHDYVVGDQIKILGSLIGGVDVTNDLTITVATVSNTAYAGGTASFSVTAAGQATLQYQWQSQIANTVYWNNINGATSSTLSLTGINSGNDQELYRVRISSTGGAVTTFSNSAKLTVTHP
jgi:hypothetical protein